MRTLIIVLIALITSACGEGITTLSSDAAQQAQCSADVAQVAVMDGFLQILCGCNEPAGTLVASGSAFTCTIPTGHSVVFQYVGTQLDHQVISQGSPSFVSSPNTRSSHAVKFTDAGTYAFTDAYNSSQQGSIVVTP